MTLCRRPVIIMEFACEVWDPYLVKHQTQLENVQRPAVRFLAGLRGVESVTKAREKLGLDLLADGQTQSSSHFFTDENHWG